MILLLLSMGAAADTADTALVLSLSGSGRLLSGGSTTPLHAGDSVPPGATVCTDAGSYATLRLAIDSRGAHDEVTLLAATCLAIRAGVHLDHRTATLSVQSGAVSVRAAPDAGGSVTVETASGVTSGEGGGFRVTVEAGAARTEALYAPVSLEGAGSQRTMEAGFGSRTQTGEAPGDPVPLLLPGTPALPEDGAALTRPDFTWTPVERALGYRVEIASSADFARLLMVEEAAASPWKPDMLYLPYRVPGLWWRISSFDRTGFVGLPSEPRRLAIPSSMGL